VATPAALTIEEAERLEQLPTIKFVVVNENGGGDIEFEGRRHSAVNINGRDADWPRSPGRRVPGRSFSDLEDKANALVVVVNDKLAEQLFANRDPIGRRIKIAGLP